MRSRRSTPHPAPTHPLAVALAAGLACVGPALAQPVDLGQDQKLAPASIDSQDRFGLAVALSGDVAVIGAVRDEVGVGDSGTVHVYRNAGGWGSEAVLSASDAAANDTFGTAVDVEGNVIIVGSPLSDIGPNLNAGAAYVYRFNGATWTREAKLTASDGLANHSFGTSVSLSGDVAVVGSPFAGNGAVYVYRYDSLSGTWSQEAKLVDGSSSPGAQLGTSVAIAGDVLIAGAPFEGGGGEVLAFAGPGGVWSQTGSIAPPLGVEADAQFGHAVAFDGDRAIIGAHLDHVGAHADAGSAYIYGFDGAAWTQEAALTAPTTHPNDFFGFAVDICGSTAIVGAQFGDGAVADSGDAHVWRFDGVSWSQESRLVAGDGAAGDFFGYAVAACETAIVGAWGDVPAGFGGTRWGSAYVYEIGPAPVADSDGDGIDDVDEIALGTDPFDADSDDDGLSDGDEVNVHFTDPLNDDTDGDLLSDGDEILSAFGGCPDPLVADSDGDGLDDGYEVFNFLDPCDSDFDDDGLADGLESLYGTDPTNPDTDGDGLLDGTEVDIAQGSGCPSPTLADSDGDGLSDTDEDLLGTSPCSVDTDGDGVNDNIDDQPTVPGVSQGFIVDVLNDLADDVWALPLSEFEGPNDNARRGRRLALYAALRVSGALVAHGNDRAASVVLQGVLRRIDGDDRPRDWMEPGPARDDLYDEISLLIDLLGA